MTVLDGPRARRTAAAWESPLSSETTGVRAPASFLAEARAGPSAADFTVRKTAAHGVLGTASPRQTDRTLLPDARSFAARTLPMAPGPMIATRSFPAGMSVLLYQVEGGKKNPARAVFFLTFSRRSRR